MQTVEVNARDAIDRGCRALASDDRKAAVAWFERAHRLLPNQVLPHYLLASALATIDGARALDLLRRLLELDPDHREARISQIAIFEHCRNHSAAADALETLLSRFVIPDDESFFALADLVANNAGLIGWAGILRNGIVVCYAPAVSVFLDRTLVFRSTKRRTRRQLPDKWLRSLKLTSVSDDGVLAGATIDLRRLQTINGLVGLFSPGGISGWVQARADSGRKVTIDLYVAGSARLVSTTVADLECAALGLEDVPEGSWGFRLTLPTPLLGEYYEVHARGHGQLFGSPLTAGVEIKEAKDALVRRVDRWRPIPAMLAEYAGGTRSTISCRKPIAIIIPVYGQVDYADACLESLQYSRSADTRIIVVDDNNSAADARRWLKRAEKKYGCEVISLRQTSGFPAAVNAGILQAQGSDVILLNTDTLMPVGGVDRLARAAYAAPDIATVTPMTNDGSMTTLGTPEVSAFMPSGAALAHINVVLQAANDGLIIDLPTCNGFCVYIRSDCIAEIGLLRTDAFSRGYGEENDFSRRAAALGCRNVAACDVAVAHAGGASFGPFRKGMIMSNLQTIERLHPGYSRLIEAFIADDPLRPARFRYDAFRWREGHRSAAVILVTHDEGGGVEHYVKARVTKHRGLGCRTVVVRSRGGFKVSDGIEDNFPNLQFNSVEDLAAFLKDDSPVAVELHHIANHDAGIERLAGLLRIPFDIFMHDFAMICPRVTFFRAGTYCGEPLDAEVCNDCVADFGARVPMKGSVQEFRSRFQNVIGASRRLVVATHDVVSRVKRFMPYVNPTIEPWEADIECLPYAEHRIARATAADHVRAVTIGAIGEEKGYNVLLACARDAMRRNLPIDFMIVGHTIDDQRLISTGRVFITGPFRNEEAPALVAESCANIGFLPSQWPETWCYALTHLFRTGLPIVAFDLGSQAERLRTRGNYVLLPLSALAQQINNDLIKTVITSVA